MHVAVKKAKDFPLFAIFLVNCVKPTVNEININLDQKVLYRWVLANQISIKYDKSEIIFLHKPDRKNRVMIVKMNSHKLYPSCHIKIFRNPNR